MIYVKQWSYECKEEFKYLFKLIRLFFINLKEKILFYKKHLKDCFTSITPSETNYYNQPTMFWFQCNEAYCGQVFRLTREENYCPHCGSSSFIPISSDRNHIVYQQNEITFSINKIEKN